MIIGYSLPNAIASISDGIKIHTLREDKHKRFKVGQVLDHCTGVRTKFFQKHITNACTRIDSVEIDTENRRVKINGQELKGLAMLQFISNDGFISEIDFWHWFSVSKKYRLIQWTNFNYFE